MSRPSSLESRARADCDSTPPAPPHHTAQTTRLKSTTSTKHTTARRHVTLRLSLWSYCKHKDLHCLIHCCVPRAGALAGAALHDVHSHPKPKSPNVVRVAKSTLVACRGPLRNATLHTASSRLLLTRPTVHAHPHRFRACSGPCIWSMPQTTLVCRLAWSLSFWSRVGLEEAATDSTCTHVDIQQALPLLACVRCVSSLAHRRSRSVQ